MFIKVLSSTFRNYLRHDYKTTSTPHHDLFFPVLTIVKYLLSRFCARTTTVRHCVLCGGDLVVAVFTAIQVCFAK